MSIFIRFFLGKKPTISFSMPFLASSSIILFFVCFHFLNVCWGLFVVVIVFLFLGRVVYMGGCFGVLVYEVEQVEVVL